MPSKSAKLSVKMQTEQSIPAHRQHRKIYDLVPRFISRIDGDTGLYTGDNVVFMEYIDKNDWVFLSITMLCA